MSYTPKSGVRIYDDGDFTRVLFCKMLRTNCALAVCDYASKTFKSVFVSSQCKCVILNVHNIYNTKYKLYIFPIFTKCNYMCNVICL